MATYHHFLDMASIAEWNTAQRVAWRGAEMRSYGNEELPFIEIIEMVVCTHGIKRNGENVTLMIYRIQLSNPTSSLRTHERSQHTRARLRLTFGTLNPGRAATEPPKVLAWAPYMEPKRSTTSDLDDASESNMRGLLGVKAKGTAELQLGKEWEENFKQSYGYTRSSDRHFGTMTEVEWDFPPMQEQRRGLSRDFHLAVIVKPPQHPGTARALPFTGEMEFDIEVGRYDDDSGDDFARIRRGWRGRDYGYGISLSRDGWYGSSRHDRKHIRLIHLDPTAAPHFSGSGHRVRKFLQPNGTSLELGEGMNDALLALIGVINDYSYSTFKHDTMDVLGTRRPDPTEEARPNGPFLDALLHPNEHVLRLEKIRAHVAFECQISELIDTSDHMLIDQERCRDLLCRVARSLDLLQKAGLARNSLILLADDPTRNGVIQSIELDIRDLENLQNGWVDVKNYEPPNKLLRNAQQLLEKLGIKSTSRDEQRATYCILVAMATASYAGSHCYPIGSDLDLASVEHKTFGFGLCIRSCHFACLHRYIGGPVWVLSPESSTGQRRSYSMLLSITPEHFDDLWGL